MIGPASPTLPVRELFGIPICAVTMTEALDAIERAIAGRQRLQIGVVNAAKIVNMRRDAQLRQDVLASDLIVADGMSVVWASRLLGRALPERVTGIDLMLGLLQRANKRWYRVYCLGATPEVLAKTVARIRTDFPHVIIAGQQDGYFTREDSERVASDIAAAKADILFVAMTSPKKEHFMAAWGATLHVPVCHGVGGSFDVLAGKVKRAPEAWQRLGLEWLYRVKQEPLRLWRRYLVTNALFCQLVARECVRQRINALRRNRPAERTA
jgi:N-acetylglucosaminyldiphosphoundecaprenol N-acetyl-beta-D-mannosaminyltransferase